MRGVMRVGMSGGVAVVALGLLAATPTPVAPRAKVGTVCEVHRTLRIASTVHLKLPSGPRTMPAPSHVDETQRLEVLAVSGGVITRLRITYVSVDAEGPGTSEDQGLTGRRFVVSAGTSPAARPEVTEHGKPVKDKLGRKIWDDVVAVMGTAPARRFLRRVLAKPGTALKVPAAIYPDLAEETEEPPQLLSGSMRLEGVAHGLATTRLVAHERISDGSVTMDMRNTTTTRREVATGRVRHMDLVSLMHGHGTMELPVGPVPTTLEGKATGTAVFTWRHAGSGAK